MATEPTVLDRCSHCGGDLVYGETILVVGRDDERTREAVIGTCDARDITAAYHPGCFRPAAATGASSA